VSGLTGETTTADTGSFPVFDWIVHDRADFNPVGEAEEATCKYHEQLVCTGPGGLEAVMLAAEESVVCLETDIAISIGTELETPKYW
jgi:hypothetical protein